MKRIALAALLVVFGASASFAQTKPAAKKKVSTTTTKAPVKPATEGAGMVFENETIDYGNIQQNSDGNREFVFTNNGNKPLIIESTQGSCGCTVPTKPDGPIAPGARATIGVKYDTNRVGPFTKTVTVKSNAAGNETKLLTIKGNVLAAPATTTGAEPTKS